MVTTSIIGILASVSVANFEEYRASAKDVEAYNLTQQGALLAETWMIDHMDLSPIGGDGTSNSFIIYRNLHSVPYDAHHDFVVNFIPHIYDMSKKQMLAVFVSNNKIYQVTSGVCGANYFYHNHVRYHKSVNTWVNWGGPTPDDQMPFEQYCGEA